jgi:hypothetical protein
MGLGLVQFVPVQGVQTPEHGQGVVILGIHVQHLFEQGFGLVPLLPIEVGLALPEEGQGGIGGQAGGLLEFLQGFVQFLLRQELVALAEMVQGLGGEGRALSRFFGGLAGAFGGRAAHEAHGGQKDDQRDCQPGKEWCGIGA